MIAQDEIKKAKHIVIEYNSIYFAQASALYSYILTLHKKVSLFSEDESFCRYAFLPWYEKSRSKEPSSADLKISANIEIFELYSFFKKRDIHINKKMATALYAGFLERYENFLSRECDGTIFAAVSELIAKGAECRLCIDELIQKVPLRIFRLKSIVYRQLLLKKNAELVYVSLDEQDFITTGAKWNDLNLISKELLNLANVKEVLIIKSDEVNKIINLKKEV